MKVAALCTCLAPFANSLTHDFEENAILLAIALCDIEDVGHSRIVNHPINFALLDDIFEE